MRSTVKLVIRILTAVLAVLMLAVSAACDNRVKETGELPDDYVPEIRGKLKLSCINGIYSTEESQRGVKNWLNMFRNKHPDVTIETDFNINDYSPLIASKSLGDLFYITDGGLNAEDTLYQYAIVNEAMMPLDSYVEAYGIDLTDIYGGILNLGYVEGKLYFVGMDCGNITFTYDVDAMVEAGVLAPGEKIGNDWTWEDFKNICERLKLYDVDGTTLTQVGAAYRFTWQNMFTPFLYAYGGKWYDKENKRVNLDNENVRKGIREAIEVIDRRLVYPCDTRMSSAMRKEYGTIGEYRGCVFNITAAYASLASMVRNYAPGTEWDCAPFPLFPEAASPCGSLGFSVFSYTRNRDTAAALALSLLTEEGQYAIHSQIGGDVPLLKKLGEQDFWHLRGDGFDGKNYDCFTANYENYVPGQLGTCVPPEIANIIQDGITELFNSYCTGEASWEYHLTKMQEKANQMWESLYYK